MRLKGKDVGFGPVRKIGKSYRSITGTLPSPKAGGGAAYESTLERDFLMRLEFDPQVRWISPQPLTLEYPGENGRSHCYTPDVLVHYLRDKPPGLFEVKYVEEIREKREHFGRLFRVARADARERGWTFTLVTEKSIRGPLLKNAQFLLPFRDLERVWSTDVRDKLLHTLQAHPNMTPEALLSRFELEERAALLPMLWHLIATHQITVDLHAPLTLYSSLILEKVL